MNDSFVKRFLLTCNPWFLASTLLLLIGIYLVYVDPKLAGEDMLQINISFYSLQAYELLCLGVIFLFRRIKLFYDSVFLVVILCMLLFVPFITFNHAIQHEGLSVLGYLALFLAVIKMGLIKVLFKELNLPWMILAAGLLMLIMNFSLPFAMHGLNLEDDLSGEEFINDVFSVAIPMIGLIGYFAMNQIKSGKRIFESKWLPITLFECFFTVTLINLMSVMFVYDIEYSTLFFSASFLVSCFLSLHPIIGLSKTSKRVILLIAFVTSVLFLGPEFKLHFSISLVICLLFALGAGDKWIGFAAFSFLLVLALNKLLVFNMSFSQLCLMSGLLLSVLLVREKQEWQMLVIPGVLFELFLLTHKIDEPSLLVFLPMSLCLFITMLWDKKPFKDAEGIIISLSILWAVSGFFCHVRYGWSLPFAIGIFILSVQLVRTFMLKQDIHWILLSISSGVILMWPVEELIRLLKTQSFSIIVIAVSFIIFIAGTIATYSKRLKTL